MINSFSRIAEEIVLAGLQLRTPILPENNCIELQGLLEQAYCIRETPDNFFNKKEIDFVHSNQIVVPVSGGLDSSVVFFRAEQEFGELVKAVYIDTNQDYKQKELKALKELGIQFEVVKAMDFSDKGDYWDHILPGRNFYYLSLLAESMSGGKILFGATQGEIPESGGDKSKEFFSLVNRLFKTLPYPVIVETPLDKETKNKLIFWWKDNLPLALLQNTISCFSDEEGHCGRCRACLRKALSFISNNLELETNTSVLSGCKEYIEEYKYVMSRELESNNFIKYSYERCINDLKAIRRLESLR